MSVCLCIYNNVQDVNIITNSLQPNVTLVNSKSDILSLPNLSRVGFMFHNDGSNGVPSMFHTDKQQSNITSDSYSYKLKTNTVQPRSESTPQFTKPTPSQYVYYNSHLISFLSELKAQFGTFTFDIISCSMNDPNFIAETNTVQTALGINIEYSLNQTGNGSDADWILESNGENLKGLYFTDNINTWNHVLIYATYTGSDVNTYINSNITYSSGVYTLQANIDLGAYNILLNDGEVFDGNNYSIYPTISRSGFFITNSRNKATTIKNLTVDYTVHDVIINDLYAYSINESSIGGGGIVRPLQSNFTLNNCNVLHPNIMMQANCGGLVGMYCSSFDIIDCTTVGSCLESGTGGLVAPNCVNFLIKNSTNNMNENQCSSEMPIGFLVGFYCSNFRIINCINNGSFLNGNSYSGEFVSAFCNNFTITNSINNDQGGYKADYCAGFTGILCFNFVLDSCTNYNIGDGSSECSGFVGYGSYDFTIKRCTNHGLINGWGSGGIVAPRCSNFTVIDCVNYGAINELGCGGICGATVGTTYAIPYWGGFKYGDNNVKIISCTNNGSVNSDYCGGIAGQYFGTIRTYGNYNFLVYTNMSNGNYLISNCVNNGLVSSLNSNSGGILGSYCGSLINEGYSNYNNPTIVYNGIHSDISINNCTTTSGNLCGTYCLYNQFDGSSGYFYHSLHSSLIIRKSYTGNSVSKIIGSVGSNVNNCQISYIDSSGNVTDLIANPNTNFYE